MVAEQPTGPAVEPDGSVLGITAAAGLILMLTGVFGMIQRIVGIVDNDLYVVTNKWLFELDAIAWGWGHILIGLISLCAGVGLFFGGRWARALAIVIAVFGILANCAWLPYYPMWAVLVIAFDLFVIWAVTVHGSDFGAST